VVAQLTADGFASLRKVAGGSYTLLGNLLALRGISATGGTAGLSASRQTVMLSAASVEMTVLFARGSEFDCGCVFF
jgi:hypothetical protein